MTCRHANILIRPVLPRGRLHNHRIWRIAKHNDGTRITTTDLEKTSGMTRKFGSYDDTDIVWLGIDRRWRRNGSSLGT